MEVSILLERVSGVYLATASHEGSAIAESSGSSGDQAVNRVKAKVIDLAEEDVEFEVMDLVCD